MTVYEMLYDLDQRMSGVDNSAYHRFRLEQKFWLLNEAQRTFIKAIAFPHQSPDGQAFESTQRTVDDIREIVVDMKTPLAVTMHDEDRRIYSVTLPPDYMHHSSSYSIAVKSGCKKNLRNYPVRHADLHEEDPFTQSSFEWEEVNIRFVEKRQMLLFGKPDFDIRGVLLNYVRRPKFIHAADRILPSKELILPGGERLVGSQDCELSDETHQEIVAIAVLMATGGFQHGDLASKAAMAVLSK